MPFLGGRGQASRGYFGGGTTPDAPTSLVSTKGNGEISVAFTAPGFDGGLPITTYQYALSTSNYETFITRSTGTTASPLVITGLTNGTSYGVRIRAVNSLGAGAAGIAAAEVTPSTVPSAPTITSSPSNVNGQVTVTWNALANTGSPRPDGGAGILSYTLQHSASSTFASGVVTVTGIASTSHTVSGLTNGTTRYFKVLGVNLNGDGAYSATASGTPSTVPGTPTNVQGTANGVTSSTVTWTAPAAANTGPNFTDITGYKVEYAISPYSSYTEFTANTGNANTSISVTGLTNGGSYKFKVTARNSNGLGTTSTPSDVVVTNIVPGAPTIGTMTLSTTNTTDSLAWTAPTANGGSAITGYVYAVSTDSYATATATTNGLTASQTFNPGYTTATTTVKIAAVNSLGTGPFSAASAVGYGGWANPSYSIDGTAGCPDCAACACPACPACDCGSQTSSGSAAQTGSKGTRSKTCYKWTRGAQENVGPFDAGTTSACTAAFSACAGSTCNCSSSGPNGGTCACSDCNDAYAAANPYVMAGSCVYATGVNTGVTGHYVYNALGGGFIRYTDGGCTNALGCGDGYLQGTSDLRYCGTSGLYRVYNNDCVQVSI